MNEQERIAKISKLVSFGDNKDLAIFEEIQELNSVMKEVIQAVQESRVESVEINNLPEFNVDLSSVDKNLIALKEEITNVSSSIKNIKEIDLSGIEKLLSKISDKPEDKIDLKELSNISSILDSILFATQSANNVEPGKQEDNVKQLIPEFKKVQDILSVLNENLVAFDVPDFDYERLAKIIGGIEIRSVGGGGGGLTAIESSALLGVATEAKQLPDNHRVTVSNPTADPETGLAKESGGNLDVIAGKDFATQTTLAIIKAKTDNLDTALSGIKTGTDKIISAPSTEDKQDVARSTLSDEAILLRRIVKLLESNAVVDSSMRQRISIEAITGTSLGTGVGAGGANIPLATTPGFSAFTTFWQPVWTGPVDSRYQLIDQARNSYANGIRNNLYFT